MRHQYKRKKNNKITGTLLPSNGVERIFDLYLCECAFQTSEIDVSAHIRAQFNVEAKCEALESIYSNLKTFKITFKASEKEKLFFASIWTRGVCINKYFNPRVAQSYGKGN